MLSYKILVTGSRDLSDYQPVYDALDAIYLNHHEEGLLIIHGNARGADSYADYWAEQRSNVWPVRVPADWTNDGPYGGPRRNDKMLELNPDIVLAFLQEGATNRGTRHMSEAARKRGIEVKTITVQKAV